MRKHSYGDEITSPAPQRRAAEFRRTYFDVPTCVPTTDPKREVHLACATRGCQCPCDTCRFWQQVEEERRNDRR
jgi:hypothetical protein